ncbi:MAG: D-2-hydroxyacid dehydrogenase [Eubacteriales bacterium]|nr:D-2-hydroxyacid dehydrogenase [Eubacteriales bacterium]
MKIVVTTFPFANKDLLKLKNDFPDIDIVFTETKDQVLKEISDADGVVSMALRQEQIEAGKQLKWIQSLTAGVDAYPLEYIEQRNITLTTGRGIHKIHMTEYAISMMIVAARRVDTMILNQQRTHWDSHIPQNEIHGKKLGIIGLGSIGQGIAKVANILGMEVYGIKHTPVEIEGVKKVFDMSGMDFIAQNCDYIILLLPHTQETEKIIDQKFFNLMDKEAVFINMGRGKTVNQEHLAQALKEKRFRLCISDVFETEPLPENDPLWSMDNIIITPHVCGPHVDYMAKAYTIVKNNLNKFVKGNTLDNIYSFKKGY